jgi:hypothetical protein
MYDYEDMFGMLENLLSVTAAQVDQMLPDERKVWESISAKVADMRDGDDV